MAALIIFIKNPELGKVKTRLAKTVGDEKAYQIYLELTRITRENALLLRGVTPYVFYSDFINHDDEWHNQHFEKRLQQGNDLGERMFNAFNDILKRHERACIIGSDCPTLSLEILNMAFKKLETHDSVIGPASDGGYYLLGMTQQIPPQYLFENMAWSTQEVFPETLKRLKRQHYSAAILPILTDIDEEKDWLNYLYKKV